MGIDFVTLALAKKYADSKTGQGSGVSVQSDWNQNDESRLDYVKNRTHYDAFAIKEEVLPETVFSLTYRNESIAPLAQSGFLLYPKDTTYKIVFDGKEYITTPVFLTGAGSAFGNLYLGSRYHGDSRPQDGEWPDTGEPFLIINNDYYDGAYTLYYATTEGEHTFAVYEVEREVKTIDPKYIGTDWNQNDPNGAGYIKNRPFYDAAEEVALIDETITITDSYHDSSHFYYEFGRNLGLVVGNSYNVTFLGETFENVAYNGNMQFTLARGTTINIVNDHMNSFPNDGMLRPFDADIKIWSTTEEIIQLDPKYLPDSVKPFVVNIAETEVDGNIVLTVDKTYEEIVEAYENGIAPFVFMDWGVYPLFLLDDGATFAVTQMRYTGDFYELDTFGVYISAENTIEVIDEASFIPSGDGMFHAVYDAVIRKGKSGGIASYEFVMGDYSTLKDKLTSRIPVHVRLYETNGVNHYEYPVLRIMYDSEDDEIEITAMTYTGAVEKFTVNQGM